MPRSTDWVDRFVGYLETLHEAGNRGALAALRRGAGSPTGTVAAMYPYILPWAPPEKWAEDACYIVGSLFALHPQSTKEGNMGRAFSMLGEPNESLERRFVALLNSHSEDLPHHLRQAISLLKSKDIPVNWCQLLRDILHWDHEAHFVQQQWAREFWKAKVETAQSHVGIGT